MENKLKKHACRYAVVRFMPFPETEEFVNVGVIITCPLTGYFDFRLQKKKRHARVTHFFTELAKDLYQDALDMFARELSRIQFEVSKAHSEPEKIRSIFESLIHPREALIRFGEPRSRMADDPAVMLDKLFNYYVERDFVTQEYKEQVLERKIRNLVHDLHLPKPFKAMEIGDEFAAAHFPLVQEENLLPRKVIKPFFLAQSDPSKIIKHGGMWVDRIRRMRNRRTLPNSVLFAVDGPTVQDGNRFTAFEEICQDLQKLDILVIQSFNETGIVEFARA